MGRLTISSATTTLDQLRAASAVLDRSFDLPGRLAHRSAAGQQAKQQFLRQLAALDAALPAAQQTLVELTAQLSQFEERLSRCEHTLASLAQQYQQLMPAEPDAAVDSKEQGRRQIQLQSLHNELEQLKLQSLSFPLGFLRSFERGDLQPVFQQLWELSLIHI